VVLDTCSVVERRLGCCASGRCLCCGRRARCSFWARFSTGGGRRRWLRDFWSACHQFLASASDGMVFRSINSWIAAAGMRTARPQFTRGSLRRTSHARSVAGFKPSAFAASSTESKGLGSLCISHLDDSESDSTEWVGTGYMDPAEGENGVS
jgi:hypothetical protein